ncbi:hypothetical protein [Kosakonia pseudosacchari]|uniref:hypothetical protein n=1 Tax=Kosakonia pseudosacchari TaxID=1646340 RepID=UPI00188175AC|nr:hypothetical protein [Kosakonia pseudosacchari]QOV63483.1 hypothetical protein IP581_19900 [Kosakonia pseudosacchari]
MSKFFTAGTTPPGFYATRPALESVEITDELWLELLAAQFAGQQIIAGEDGMPVAADFPPVPEATMHLAG